MQDDALFNVMCTGNFKSASTPEDAIAAFAQLAKIDSQKAKAIIVGKRAIKKAIAHDKAYQLKTKLEKLGLEIKLQRVQPDTSGLGLSLAPMEKPEATKASPAPQNEHATASGLSLAPLEVASTLSAQDPKKEPEQKHASLSPNQMVCPKCELQQPKAMECQGCGVIVAKAEALLNRSATEQSASRMHPQQSDESGSNVDQDAEEAPVSTAKVFFAASVAALVGALLWQFVAVTFYYELGFLAWGIGGLIGAAAVYYGASGDNAGYLCGALALVAILGGKYLVASSFTDMYFDELQSTSSEEELTQMAEALSEQAQIIKNALASDQALREYLVEYGYVQETDPWAIDQAVVDANREEIELVFEDYEPMVNMYSGDDLEGGLSAFATSEVFKDSFSWVDIIFLLLGVSTAYRMASEGSMQLINRD